MVALEGAVGARPEEMAVGADEPLDEHGSRQLGEVVGFERCQLADAEPGRLGELLERGAALFSKTAEIRPESSGRARLGHTAESKTASAEQSTSERSYESGSGFYF